MPGQDSPAPPPITALDPFRLLLDELGAFVYATDREGRYTYANRLVLQLLGYPLEAVLGHGFHEFFAITEEDAELRETDRCVLEDGETVGREETNLIRSTGEVRTYWSLKKPLRDAAGGIVGMLGISHDITEQKRLERTVREQKALLDVVLDNLDALVYMKSPERRFVYANQQLAQLFGRRVDQVVGHLDTEFMPRELADRFWTMDQEILRSGQRHAGEETIVDASGRRRHYWSVAVPWTPADGAPAVIGLTTDITELHELKEELERQTRTDALTGIANRRSFFERAGQEFARSARHGLALSLIALDLDHFKRINDRHGHLLGDRVLQAFAGCTATVLRAEDLFARTGGEEFCVLLPETGLAAAHALAERVRERTAHCRVEGAPALHFSVSLGVASLVIGDAGFEALFSRADDALYEAKRLGRNRTVASTAAR